MTNHWCVNGTSLDTHSYSSPIPLIGLYIASATSVCFLFMLIDAFRGLTRGKHWLPCGLFSLNSLTLTLLSVATKIPVDLTTPMPRAMDQLSKLCGTTMICVSMGVLMPSVGANRYSESINNIISLAILVITVIVNICIQISTGVIYSFIPEHVIILICMLSLLVVLCFSTIYVRDHDDTATFVFKNLLGGAHETSLMTRVVYFYSVFQQRQRLLCSEIMGSSVVFFCALCSAVLSQAAIRSMAIKKLQFCEGISDYGWSVWMIVVSQIIIVLFGTLLTIFRFMILPSDLRNDNSPDPWTCEMMYVLPYSLLDKWNVCGILVSILKCFALVTMKWLCVVSAIVPAALLKPCLLFKKPTNDDDRLLKIDSEDFIKLIQGYKKDPLNNLKALLDKHGQPQFPINIGIAQKTSLLVVIFVRVTAALLPPDRSKSLNRALDEVFEIISYLDQKINKEPQRQARIWWMGRGICSKRLPKTESPADSTPEAAVRNAISIFKELLRSVSGLGLRLEDMKQIIDIFDNKSYTSMEELYDQIEQVFCSLVCFFLAQLPKVVLEELNGCLIGESEEKGWLAIKSLCKVEPLEDKIQWLFPEGSRVTSLVTEVPVAPV